MKAFTKYLLILLAVSIVIWILTAITAPHLKNDTSPERIPRYGEVVEQGFTSPIVSNVLDVRDTTELMQPRLGVVKVADNIVAISCPTKNQQCMIQAMLSWTRSQIEHQDALLARDFILSPEETILYRQGTSMTKSVLLSALLRAEGFETRLGSTPYSQFVEVRVDNSTILLDPGCSSCRVNQTRYNGPQEKIVWVS